MDCQDLFRSAMLRDMRKPLSRAVLRGKRPIMKMCIRPHPATPSRRIDAVLNTHFSKCVFKLVKVGCSVL